ncbi:MAG: hypothetical protein QM472_00605 [Spirochaetota bacterium]|nr:hypothetical protein [Spirochaetota bacterium]
MNNTMDITLCRPGGRRACSVCCGCFNMRDISRQSLSSFLERGLERLSLFGGGSEPELHSEVRDETTHICPFQGLAEALPGCLLHPAIHGSDGRGASLYGERICGEFFCPAHHLLDEGARRLLLSMELDWYLYSIAILDPLGFVWMLDEAFGNDGRSSGPGLSPAEAAAVKSALEAHAAFLNRLDGPIFYYSRSEYLLDYHRFSPASGSPETERHRLSLLQLLRLSA